MDWLKALLKDIPDADNLVSSIQKELPKYFKPAEVFNETNSELKATKEQLSTMTKTLEDMTKKSQTADEYKSQLDVVNAEHAEFVKNSDKRLLDVKKSALLQSALLESGADKSAIDLLAGTVDLNTVELDNDKIKNFENLLKPIKEARPTLFRTENTQGTPPPNPAGAPDLIDSVGLREAMGLPIQK